MPVAERMVKESPPFRAELIVALGWGEGAVVVMFKYSHCSVELEWSLPL